MSSHGQQVGFFLAIGLLSLAGCLQLDVDPRILPREATIPDPGPRAPLMWIKLHGAPGETTSFARAYPSSRTPAAFVFARGIRNRTGSLRALLEPALREVARRQGYRLHHQRAGADAVLSVEFARAAFTWRPPQEFIQTAYAKRPGRIEVDLLIRTTLKHRALGGVHPGTLAEFKRKRIRPAPPAARKQMLELLVARALTAYCQHLLKQLPPAAKVLAPGT